MNLHVLAVSIFLGLRLSATINADVECTDPETPLNGRKAKENATTMGYFCNPGFVLHGSAKSVCVNGEWSPIGQTCEKFTDVPEGWMRCGYPGQPLNGYRYFEKMGENKLKYVCNDSYTLVGQIERTCQKNGSWTPEIPNCVKNLAKDKKAEHQKDLISKTFSTDDSIETFVSQKADFHGYVDLEKMLWFNTVQVLIKDGDKYGDVQFYASNHSDKSLQEVYRIKSNVPKLMRFSFTPVIARYLIISFQNQTSICDIKIYNSNEKASCGHPDVPLNGSISNRSLNSATFECESGYNMIGNATIRCLHGFWENRLPFCIKSVNSNNYVQPQDSQNSQTQFTAGPTQNASDEKQSQETNIILGVGVGVAALCLIIIVAFVLFKRHRSNQNEQKKALVSGKSNNNVTVSKPQSNPNDETEDPNLLYESIDDPNYANFLMTNDKTNIELSNLSQKQPYKKNDSVSVENELYEGF